MTRKQMKTLVNRLFIISTFLLTSVQSYANFIDISEQQINQYLATKLTEKFRMQDQIGMPGLFQLNYHLHNLTTQIGRTDANKVSLSGIIDGVLLLKGKSYDAQLNLNIDTTPYYDTKTGKLYLKDIRLLNYSASPEKYQDKLQAFLPLLVDGLSKMLNNTPIYTLDENKTQEALLKKFGKAIVIEQGKLSLQTALF